MNSLPKLAAFFVCIFFASVNSHVLGQLPNARLHRVFPCIAQSNKPVDVVISGADLDETTQLIFSDPKITAKPKLNPASAGNPATPVPNQFVINVPDAVSPGVYEVRALGRFGLSTPRRFIVSADSELICTDQNKTPESAMALPMNNAVLGKAVANGKHFFKFSLKANEKVTIECQTRAIDSKMNPVLVVMDLSGNEIARSRSSSNNNAVLYFQAPIASQYLLSVRDAVFSGGDDYFYRVKLTNKPHLLSSHPILIQNGTDPEILLYGWNLKGGVNSESKGVKVESLKLKSSQLVQFPKSLATLPPNAESHRLDWIGVALGDKGIALSNQIPIYVVDQPVSMENGELESNSINVPSEVSGQFTPHNETDFFNFQGKKGETWIVEAYSHQMGRNSDLVLMVQQEQKDNDGNASWKNISVNDDPSSRGGGVSPDFSSSTDDPGLQFQVPADGTYRISVKDQFGNYDRTPNHGYRLSVRHPSPDFSLVCHPPYGKVANGNQISGSAITVRRGGGFHLKVEIKRADGFRGPVKITCQGLPEGILCNPVVVDPAQSTIDLIFQAAENAPYKHGLVRIFGEASIDKKIVSREATYANVIWDTGNKTQTPAYFRRISSLGLSVMPHDLAAATVKAGSNQVLETSIGGKIALPVKLVRRNGFAEPLKLQALNLPGNLKPGDLTIAKDKTDGSIEIFVKDKNTPIGDYQFFLKGDAKFKYARNPQAAEKADKEFQRLTEVLKSLNMEKANLEKEMQASNNSMPELEKNIQQAKQKVEGAKKTKEKMLADATKLEKAITDAKSNTKQTIDANIMSAAELRLVQLQNELKENQALQTATKELEKSEQAKSNLLAKIATQKSTVAELAAKIKTTDAGAKASKTAADNLKKQSAPKDLIAMAVSNPIQLRVVQSPVKIQPLSNMQGSAGAEVSTDIKVERKYGFQEAVNLTFKAPAGIQIQSLAIPKDKSEMKFIMKIPENCPVGSHSIEIVAGSKFNNVDVTSTSAFQLQVSAKSVDTKAQK